MKIIKIKSSFEIPINFTGIVEFLPNGDKYWYENGLKHRENGPAVEYSNGIKVWYKEGNIHRENGPAVENLYDTNQWWLNNYQYNLLSFEFLIQTSIFLEKKEKGKYNLDWLRFLTDQGIKEFPIIPGMDFVKEYLDAVQ